MIWQAIVRFILLEDRDGVNKVMLKGMMGWQVVMDVTESKRLMLNEGKGLYRERRYVKK